MQCGFIYIALAAIIKSRFVLTYPETNQAVNSFFDFSRLDPDTVTRNRRSDESQMEENEPNRQNDAVKSSKKMFGMINTCSYEQERKKPRERKKKTL